MKTFLCILAIAILPGTAGAQDVPPNVNQRVFYHLSGTLNGFASPPLPNIGQAYHNLTLVVGNAPNQTCNVAYHFYMRLEGSFDATNWTVVAAVSNNNIVGTQPPAPATYAADGVGVYPNLRVYVQNFFSGSIPLCDVTVYYQGSLYPVFTPQRPAARGLYTIEPAQITSGTTAASVLLATGNSDNQAPFPQIAVYGIVIVNNGTASETLTLADGNGPSCATQGSATWLPTFVLSPAGGQFVLPASLVPYYEAANGQSLCMFVSASAATHNVSVSTVFRYE